MKEMYDEKLSVVYKLEHITMFWSVKLNEII